MNRQEVLAAAPTLMEPSAALLADHGFKSKVRGGDLLANKKSDLVHESVQFLIKNYQPVWLYQVHFSIGWRDIFKYTHVNRFESSPKEWRKFADIGDGTPQMHGYNDEQITIRRQSDVARVARNLEHLVKTVGLPFFERWADIGAVAHEFWESTPSARRISLLPQGLSSVAVASGLLLRGEEFGTQIAIRHREWLKQFDPVAIKQFDAFMEHMQKVSSIRYP
jgi:hypothetical protein